MWPPLLSLVSAISGPSGSAADPCVWWTIGFRWGRRRLEQLGRVQGSHRRLGRGWEFVTAAVRSHVLVWRRHQPPSS